jgi:hypothetical protein
MNFTIGGQQQYNFDGDLNDRQSNTAFGITFPNYWNFFVFWIHKFGTLDERLTRGGPVVRRPHMNFVFTSVSTDSRRNFVASLAAFFGRRYVFADLVQKTISMNTRLSLTFTPDLTLEVFAQPFISSARFGSFKEFAAPRSVEKRAYGQDLGTISQSGGVYTVDPDGTGPAQAFTLDDPNFNFRSLRGNAVLRWEFTPGSTLFLVWTQSRSATEQVGNLDFGRDVRAMFEAPTENIFLLKVNYWLGF